MRANQYPVNPLALVSTVAPPILPFLQTTHSSRSEALPPGFVSSQLGTAIQAAVIGIGVHFSSRDNGDETGGNSEQRRSRDAGPARVEPVGDRGWWRVPRCRREQAAPVQDRPGYRHVDPAERSVHADAPGGYLCGSGGGTSHLFAQASYQAGVVPATIADRNGTPARQVPDSEHGPLQCGPSSWPTRTRTGRPAISRLTQTAASSGPGDTALARTTSV